MVKPLVKQALLNSGAGLGSLVGSQIGQGPAGATIGKGIGARLSKLVGSGDYSFGPEPAMNSLFKTATGKSSAANASAVFAGAENPRVRHREFLGDVVTGGVAGQFTNTSYPINPGLATTFPYLANVAQNFEEYSCHGLVFEFVSSASAIATTGALGSVVMAMEYNPSAAPFTSKPQMENCDFAISRRMDHDIMYGVECVANVQTTSYVRMANNTGIPLTSTDLGIFQIATAPSASYPVNAIVGELWVSYDIELKRPRISQGRFGYFHGQRANPSTIDILGTITANPYVALGSLYLASMTTNTIILPSMIQGDVYFVVVFWTGIGVVTGTAPPLMTFSNCTNIPGFSNNTGAVRSYESAGWGGAVLADTMVSFYVQITGVSGSTATLSFGGDSVPQGSTVDVIVNCVGNGFTNNTV